MKSGFETSKGFAPVKDGQLYYEVSGTGQPLVLTHASCADYTMWEAQVKAFAPHYRVITYDRRGFGKTTANPLKDDKSFFDAQDLADLLQHLAVEKAHILGLSGGGIIAGDFALTFPDRITTLTIASTGYSGLEPQLIPEEYALFSEYMKLIQVQEWEQVSDLGAKVWVDGPRRPPEPSRQEIRKQVYDWLLDSHRRNGGPVDPQGMTPPAAGRLAEIKVPALVIWGDKDFTGNLAAGETLASSIKEAQKVVFEDTAHMLNLERPEQFDRVVLDFLRKRK